MKTKCLPLCLALLFLLSIFPFSAAAETPATANDVKVILDNKPLVFDVPPQIIEGRTMVPLRVIFETLGAQVSFEDETKTISARKGNLEVTMQIGSKNLFIGPRIVTLDVPPLIVDSRTLVPVRAVAESFGAKVMWDALRRTVIITSAEKLATLPTSVYSDDLYTVYDVPDFTKILTSSINDWYITLDASFHTAYTTNGSNMFFKGDDIILLQMSRVENDTTLEAFADKTIESRVGTFGDVVYSMVRDKETHIINDIPTITYVLYSASQLEELEQESGLYYFIMLAEWNGTFYEFTYSGKQKTAPKSYLDMIASFNPKADVLQTGRDLDTMLKKAKAAEPEYNLLSFSDKAIGFTQGTETENQTVFGVDKTWSASIDNAYTLVESQDGIAGFDKKDSRESIYLLRYRASRQDATLTEIAKNSLLMRKLTITSGGTECAVEQNVTDETISNRAFNTYTLHVTSAGEDIYITVYLTEYQGEYYEFTSISPNKTPNKAFFDTVASFPSQSK